MVYLHNIVVNNFDFWDLLSLWLPHLLGWAFPLSLFEQNSDWKMQIMGTRPLPPLENPGGIKVGSCRSCSEFIHEQELGEDTCKDSTERIGRKGEDFFVWKFCYWKIFIQSCVSKNIPEQIFWKVALALGWRGVCTVRVRYMEKWICPPSYFFLYFYIFVFCILCFGILCFYISIFLFLCGIVECGSEIYVKVEMSPLITRLHPAMPTININPHNQKGLVRRKSHTIFARVSLTKNSLRPVRKNFAAQHFYPPKNVKKSVLIATKVG